MSSRGYPDDGGSHGSGSGGGSSGDDGGGLSLPGWITALKVLVPVVTTLAAFASNPRHFILEHVLTFFVGLFLEAGAVVAGAFESVWLLVGRSLVSAFSPVFTAGGMIAGAVSGFLETVNAALLDVVAVAGPAAPILVMIVWVVIAIVATLIARIVLLSVPYVGQWI